MTEKELEQALIAKLGEIKYTYRPEIHDRAVRERNFHEKFEALNRFRLIDADNQRLLDEIVTVDNSHHRYDAILLINGLPIAQIELNSRYQSARLGANRRLQERLRHWLHPHATLFLATVHRQQPHRDLRNAFKENLCPD